MNKVFSSVLLSTVGVFILSITALSLSSCSIKRDNPFEGKVFSGYYRACEEITMIFEDDAHVTAKIYSKDFVGHFSDIAKGHYHVDSEAAIIEWNELGGDRNHKELLSCPDTLEFDVSGKAVLHGNGEVHALSKLWYSGLYRSKAGKVIIEVFKVILIIVLDAWYIILPIAVVLTVSGIRKARKRN